MLDKNLGLGILVFVLVFGMTVIGCGNDDEKEINFLDTLGLSTTAPGTTVLSRVGLNETQFNQIREAAGGGYRGWAVDKDDAFRMVWTDRKQANANAVEDVINGISEINLYVDFFPSKSTKGNMYIPAGTIMVFNGPSGSDPEPPPPPEDN
jgi:hypothetical protein